MDYLECSEELKNRDNFLIVSHIRPDGDTLGSCGALCHALRRLGKTAYMFVNVQTTEKYLPYIEEYNEKEDFKPDYIIAVDTAAEDMFPKGFEGKPDMCIDHHPSNSRYADKLLLKGEKSACGEIVLEVIKTLCGSIDYTEAQLLYIAVSTDTGCFQYSNTNSDTFRATAEILDAGADNHALNQKFFRKSTKARIMLEGMIFSAMTFHRDGKVAIATVTLDMMEKAQATENDCDDLASLAGRAENAVVSVTIREQENGTSKISMRSDPEVNSSDICAVYGGGGHAMAAGCIIPCPPEEAKVKILEAIDSVMK